MGHGCYYTNRIDGSKAFWIDTEPYSKDEETGEYSFDEFIWQDTIDNLHYELEELGWTKDKDYHYSRGTYELILESGHGHEIVFRLENLEPEWSDYFHQGTFNLVLANHARVYEKLAREISKYHKLRMATSGWTSGEYVPEPLKSNKRQAQN